jgi:microcystin-dependent protein
MSEPFLAEIRIVAFNFAPRGWALCDGQILPINQNQSLYSLLGTTYGGDGRTSFGLPDLRGRTPMHKGSSNGSSHALGQKSGEEAHTLNVNEVPSHDHALKATSANGDAPVPAGNMLGAYANGYRDGANLTDMVDGTIAVAGSGQSHNNMQPYLALHFCIALIGLFPSRN